MVVNDSSEATAGNGKQCEASVLLTPTLSQPFSNGLKKEEFVDRISDNEKSVTTLPPQNNFWKIHDTLEIKNRRKTGIPQCLDLPPTPTFPPSHPDDNSPNNSPASSPCVSSYFDIYQNFNSCSSVSSSESNSSNSPIDSPDTPPLSPSIIEPPSSPLSPDSIFSSLSLPLVSALTNPEQRRTCNRSRQVSFNQTVTFIPHIPPPPNKIRKKLTKEAGARQKDLILEVEDLGKVRLDGRNGRVIKIVPNVFPGPLNGGEYEQCDVMLKDVKMEISSKNQNNEEEDDDDVIYITAVPIVEKDKKLRLGKHFKRYYHKLVQ